MTGLSSRLRELLKTERHSVQSLAGVPAARTVELDPAEALGGRYRGTGSTRCLVVEREYSPSACHGSILMQECAEAASFRDQLDVLAGTRVACRPEAPIVFLDIETTGLAGGAGTYVFLVGCGAFDAGAFSTRQFFLSGHAAERGLLAAVSDWLGDAGVIVTFNGKTFDVPVIETRYLFHRVRFPLARLSHVDMLHTARRLWRGEESCALQVLEHTLLGVRREGDVPGAEIPARYLHYIRTGDARPLAPVLEHNRLDLRSLAVLTARAMRMAQEGPAAARDPGECLGLGRLYDRAGLCARAIDCYAAASREGADRDVRAEALRRLALRLRRERRHHEAAAAWQQVLALASEKGRGSGVGIFSRASGARSARDPPRAPLPRPRRRLCVRNPRGRPGCP